MNEFPAYKIVQYGLHPEGKPTTLLITAMTVNDLQSHVKADLWDYQHREGYQRPVIKSRMRDFYKHLSSKEGEGAIPTSILLGVRPNDEPKIELEGFEDGDSLPTGVIKIPENATLWVVDGMHRFNGVLEAVNTKGALELLDYPFPVTIMWQVDHVKEMVHFSTINTTQRKMATDIVDANMQARLRQGMLSPTDSKGIKAIRTAHATNIADILNQDEGVWQGKFVIPNIPSPNKTKGTVNRHTFVVSLEPALADDNFEKWVKNDAGFESAVKVVKNFWQAVSEVFPEPFADPDSHRIHGSVGLYSLNGLLPTVVTRCIEEGGDFQVVNMREMLLEMVSNGMKENFWHKHDGDILTKGTGMGSIRALTAQLKDLLRGSYTDGYTF